ncbi:MAG TPA: CDP-diacylglycerol--serine O-phosphatidyltransferase, partial [Planctomycetaceae bacterium]|nr:CDP-diacylglycerol--serine O-phosphatidyltransferase [Planctomycetaceae bacterium]
MRKPRRLGSISKNSISKKRRRLRPELRRKMRQFPVLPTVITMSNGVCGLLAIAVVTDADRDPIDRLFHAGLLIFLGMVFDVADGHAARLMKQTSRFGTELDSLCDLVTFGAAPAFIVMQFNQLVPQRLLFGIAASYFVAAALRLARFNVEKDFQAKTVFFQGLPTPLAAGTIASFAISVPSLQQLVTSEIAATKELGHQLRWLSMVVVPALSAGLAWLMVSRVKYPHLARQL